MAGMADLGIETDQGWIFQWESTTENPLVEFVIASHPREALEIYEKNIETCVETKISKKDHYDFKKNFGCAGLFLVMFCLQAKPVSKQH
jgi:hypothetical protein